MTSRRVTRAIFFGVTLALATAAASPRLAHAQTAEELDAARALFQEAYKDEQEKRYDQALDKFRRVAKVRESASVRYRIGSVLEALGRDREARDAFRAIAAQKSTLEQKDQDIADSAAERARDLDKKIPRLNVTVAADAPADARVTVDGAAVPTGRPLELDPGDHVVQATATGMKPFEGHVKLGEGGDTPFAVTFEPGGPAEPPPGSKSHKTLAYVAIGAGGALLVTGVVMLLVREGDISSINDSCPGGVCPTSTQSDIQSKQDQAKLFGPLGVTLGVVGAAAAGVGVYLLLKHPSASSASTTTGALRISPRPVPGGAMLGMGTAF
jgi:hypothetical protein